MVKEEEVLRKKMPARQAREEAERLHRVRSDDDDGDGDGGDDSDDDVYDDRCRRRHV